MKRAYFSKKIVGWYEASHRDLPWRNTQDPYKIWLSEIILQQTRVAQGLPYYKRFTRNYPNVNHLAAATEREVLRLWQGLGYYTRARNLHACARKVSKSFKGKFPTTCEQLRELPGIGDYTAAAIASFAFQEKVAVVDGNVYRVLSRIFGIDKDIASPTGKKFFSEFANQLLPSEGSSVYNQAIMEFGAMQCLPQNPKCDGCTFQKGCYAFQHGQQHLLPVKSKKKASTRRYFYYFIFRRGMKILMTPRIQNDIWKGLFDFPMVEGKKALPASAILGELNVQDSGAPQLTSEPVISVDYKHILTHQTIHARFVEIDLPAGEELPSRFSSCKASWYSARQLEKLPKPRLVTRYLESQSIL